MTCDFGFHGIKISSKWYQLYAGHVPQLHAIILKKIQANHYFYSWALLANEAHLDKL
jgi:hypothetical protein